MKDSDSNNNYQNLFHNQELCKFVFTTVGMNGFIVICIENSQ